MEHLHPTREQLQALRAMSHDTGPIEMINLLRFRAEAAYPENSGFGPCSGREAYARYAREVLKHLEAVGARPVWQGAVRLMVIGPDDKHWDEAIIVRYPSVAAFLRMTTDPAYLATAVHRSAALNDSRLIMTAPSA